MLRAYYVLYDILGNSGKAASLNIMDNEASTSLNQLLQKIRILVQLAPPHSHRKDSAERAIRTFKNNFVSILASVDKNVLIYIWFRKVKKPEIKISLLITPRKNRWLSVNVKIFGILDFNATPMVPPGTKITAHEKQDQRETWSKHSVAGWYTSPSLEHYRCYKVFVTETIPEIISDVVEPPSPKMWMCQECHLPMQLR